MPEGVEIEIYRRAAEQLVGAEVTAVEVTDGYLRGGHSIDQVRTATVGAQVRAARRIGKLLLLDLVSSTSEPTLGLRFGMTGRLVVDGSAPIEELLYTTAVVRPEYVRARIDLGDRWLEIHDPRRLGSIELAPDEDALGVDAFSVSVDGLADALRGGRGPLKARLLDQQRVAGVGNLIADETLWRVGLAPDRRAGSLTPDEVDRLAAGLRSTMAELLTAGGSHQGQLQGERHRDGRCPLDGAELRRGKVGGRTTYWCPIHQAFPGESADRYPPEA